MYLMTTSLQGVSSMKLHRDLMEGVAKAIFATPPQKQWRHLSKR